jgi:hypothetical protein
MAADSWGVMGMFWGLSACVYVSRSRRSSMSGGAACGVSHGRVQVVGNVLVCVPGGGNAELADLQIGVDNAGNAELADLQIGVDNAGRLVVLIKQLVQCARIVGECAANKAMSTHGSALATLLGHGHALEMATWGKHKQCTCEVKHVAAVLEWAVDSYGDVIVLAHEKQRAEPVAAVRKAACDLAATQLTRSRDTMADSIGVESDGVDAEVNRLGAGLESAKEDLVRTHTELAAVQAEADRVSHTLTGVKLDLEREGRTCKTLEGGRQGPARPAACCVRGPASARRGVSIPGHYG